MSNLYMENAELFCMDCRNEDQEEGFYEEGDPNVSTRQIVCDYCGSRNVRWRVPGEIEVEIEAHSSMKANLIKMPKEDITRVRNHFNCFHTSVPTFNQTNLAG